MPGSKTFIIKFFIFCVPVVAALSIYTCYWYRDNKYQDSINGREIYWAIKKSAKHKKVKKLLIGDSIGQQLFDNRKYNDSIYSLACNQAISCVGFYELLKSFTDTNRDSLPEQVILVTHPLSLQNNLDQVYTFHYFLKPFYCAPYKQYFSETVNSQIEKVPFYYLSQFPFIKISNWSPDYRPENAYNPKYLSPITVEYITRIKNLCDNLHIPFAIVAPPVSDVHRNNITQNTQAIMNEAAKMNMQAEFAFYLHSIKYMDNALYGDEMHFHDPEKVDVNYIKTLTP